MEILGVPLPGPVHSLGRLARGLGGLALSPLDWLPGQRPRRAVWACPERIYVQAHGVHGPGGELVARRIERALGSHPGVRWAKVNAPTSRVVIAVSDPEVPHRELIEAVAGAEAEPATEEEQIVEEDLHHPADGTQATPLPSTLVVDVAGLFLSMINKLAPWTPLPAELAGLTSAIDLHPRLRELAARGLHGHDRADSTTSMLGAVAHGLAARSESTLLDIAARGAQWREARAQHRAWCAAEGRLITGPEHAEATPIAVERPRPLPEGQADRYARRAMAAGAGAAAAALPFTGPRRAAAVGLASLPKAPATAAAAFAARLGHVLARRGTLVMDRAVLRRLDLVDVLVLDVGALSTGRAQLSDLVPLPDSDPAELASVAFELFNATDPAGVRRDGDWALGPVDQLNLTGRTGAAQRRQLRARGATGVLGLAKGRRLLGVLGTVEEIPSGVDTVAAAARDAGLRVLMTGQNGDGAADGTLPAGSDATDGAPESQAGPGLVAGVRELQADGHVVALVSADRHALGAADCGIGVYRDGDPPPWGAHLLIGQDLETAVLLVEAVTAARAVNRDATMLAKAASGIGAVNALGNRRRPAASSLRAVNAGAAMAFADGIWRTPHTTRPVGTPVGRAVPPWHLMPTHIVLDRVGSGRHGLTDDEAGNRRPADRGGQGGGTSLARAFLGELANPLTPVLAGGAAVSAAVGSPVDAALVAGVVGVSALVGSVQQVHTERALASLFERSAVTTTVVRDGTQRRISADELVVGDVVSVNSGDVVPADCRLVEATGLEVDESSLTGESLPVAKDVAPVFAAEIAERTSMVYEGTTIAAGRAVAVVVATGDATEVGRGMAAARRGAPTTGVEARLASLTRRTVPVALGSALAVTGAGLLRGVPMRESLGAAVNLAVASVPEGLPFVVSAAQLAAARRLAELGALVRNPRTIEALGRVDVLCFDKTGTLTEGRLALSRVDDGRHVVPVDSLGDSHRAVLAAAVRATPRPDGDKELPHQTDRAVLEGARTTGVGADIGASGWKKSSTVPFEPSRGYHATVGRGGKRTLLSVKGAPEVVVPRCTSRRDDNGSACPIDAAARRRLERRAEELAASGNRVLAVAERTVSTEDDASEDAVSDLCLLGLIALSDRVRDSAAPAAAQLREAGVHTVMITGDHPATGEAVAGEVNGHNGEAHDVTVLTGAEIDELDDQRLDELLPTVDVIARCSPAQKVRIIQAYQRLDRVVAMTGDGANDAPAIRLADVGIALGQRGTPAARAAADLVVTDDRLETIIEALVEGRAMWKSVREALGIMLGGNLGEIAFTVLGSVVTGRSPLTARQLLLVNLLTDLAPALAIALSRPGRELHEGPGTSLGTALTRDIAGRAVTTTLGTTAAWTLARLTGRSRRASTVALAALVGTQLGQTFAAGGRDRGVLAAGLGSAAVLATVIQTPGLSQFFGCTPLGPVGWSIALGSAGAANLLGPRD